MFRRPRGRLASPSRLTGRSLSELLADPEGFARRREITLARAGTSTLVEVTHGLAPTDKLIAGNRDGLTDGQRIRIAGTEEIRATDR